MTGSKRLLHGCSLVCLLSAAPALAQLPNGTAAGPDAAPPTVSTPQTDDNAVPPAGASQAPKLPPKVDVRYGSATGPLSHPQLQSVQLTYGGELTLDADQADANLAAAQYDLRGDVRLHEADTSLRADEVTVGPRQEAAATNALLSRAYYSVRAPRIAGMPEKIVAYNGDFTTVPNGGPADYYLHAQTITLDSAAHRGTLRNATLYLFGVRLVTFRRLSFGLGKSGGAEGMRLPVQYRVLLPTRQTVQASVTSFQTLYAPRVSSAPAAPYAGPVTLLDRIRAAATVPPGPLPEGDPLRFRDFLPDPNPIQLFNAPSHGGLYLGEDLSTHVASSGRRRTDLYVSRLPEVTLSGNIPLSPVPSAPIDGDPQSFRAALRHVVLYAQAQQTIGEYEEQSLSPGRIRASRVFSQAGLYARPLLIAPNTVLLPSLSITSSSYSGSKSAYRYDQVNVAVNHYFSDLTAVGVQFLASTTSGDSPFNFDVLDTSRELDLRFQTGTARLVAAGRIRYDLAKGGVIDYQAAVGPSLRGFIPVFFYNFRTRSIGLGLEVKGLTF